MNFLRGSVRKCQDVNQPFFNFGIRAGAAQRVQRLKDGVEQVIVFVLERFHKPQLNIERIFCENGLVGSSQRARASERYRAPETLVGGEPRSGAPH